MIICDYGDIHDPVKWDFDESNIPIFIINNYVDCTSMIHEYILFFRSHRWRR